MFSLIKNQNDDNFLQKYLLTDISGVTYAFKVEFVKEIIPLVEMFTIDSLDNNITGLVNLRGVTIPVFDVRGFLGKEILPLSVHQKFLVLKTQDDTFAIIIDDVGDIIDINAESISALPSSNLSFLKATAINNKTVLVIDTQIFFEYTKIAKNVNKLSSNDLMPTDAESVEKVRNRVALLGKNANFLLQENLFMNEKFIIFKLGDEIYSFNITYIKEIRKVSDTAITRIPGVPDFMQGIINFRGDYISLLDIKPFLHIPQAGRKKKFDIVILKVNDLKLAMLIDDIIDVTTLPISNINPEVNPENSFIIGDLPYLSGKMINILNIERIFSAENINIENYE